MFAQKFISPNWNCNARKNPMQKQIILFFKLDYTIILYQFV